LTLGRVRENASLSETQNIRAALAAVQAGNVTTVRVEAIHLFKSDLQPGGAVYTKLFSASLSKP
jgi:2'-5' RNA ligase